MTQVTEWIESTGLPTGGPAELVVSLVAVCFAGWLLMHLLFDD